MHPLLLLLGVYSVLRSRPFSDPHQLAARADARPARDVPLVE